jgi:hypothetical protein
MVFGGLVLLGHAALDALRGRRGDRRLPP